MQGEAIGSMGFILGAPGYSVPMADPGKAWADNEPGEFFVDSTCIDCDTCRQLAPRSFRAVGDHSCVAAQPASDDERRAAWRALLACPTASIGSRGESLAREAMADFPLELAPGVYYAGFTSRSSYGASSYVVTRPDGNWLVDSPKYHPQIFTRLAAMGGLAGIFLTHRDDVADAARYAAHFKCPRVIHRRDADAVPDAERVIEGDEPVRLAPGVTAIPTPGHTAGHCALHVDDRYLFTGDHLAWDREHGRLTAHPDVCWDSWSRQTASVERLLALPFTWILPGHGERVELPPDAMRAALSELIARMKA